MHVQRSIRLITRIVLMWYVAFVGAAVASPLVSPAQWQMICSGSGMVLVDIDNDDADSLAAKGKGMECPLCVGGAAPPPAPGISLPPPSPLAYVLQKAPAAHIAVLTAPPLPSRGPPAQI